MEKKETGHNTHDGEVKSSEQSQENSIDQKDAASTENGVSQISPNADNQIEEIEKTKPTSQSDQISKTIKDKKPAPLHTDEPEDKDIQGTDTDKQENAIETEKDPSTEQSLTATIKAEENRATEKKESTAPVQETDQKASNVGEQEEIMTENDAASREISVEPQDEDTDQSETKQDEQSVALEEKTSAEKIEKSGTADEEEEEQEAHLDYSNYTKKQMVQVLESLLKEDDFSQVGRILKEIRKPYDILAAAERKTAYERYIEDGGEKDGFEYRPDELDQRFNLAFNKLRERKSQYYNSLEKQKEQNLQKKLEILEKLREIVDSEETGTSIKALKELQNQWKEVGVIPSSQVKSLWANYNALLDRFYDQRSIYFELKELDRKKNYDLKIELCKKAEELDKQENIQEVIKQLNELHEEFKHIGPVPKEEQDAVWERFKAASDKIYSKRKEFYEKLKGELKINEVAKEALVEKVKPYAEYNSDRISDWNSKTKEIIAIQKEWEAIGSLPKEKAKTINKQFWSSFKSFFNRKGQFFRKIEEERRSNLKEKQALVEKADSLKDSEDFRKTSDELKRLQKKWKEIGPVPEKYRNEVFAQFKSACDHFFNRKRENAGKMEKDYLVNLEKKQSLCEELEKMLKAGEIDVERVKAIEAEWSKIGFVPRSNIKSIQNRYTEVIGKITDKADIPEVDKHKMRFSAQFGNVNYGPGAEKMIQKKEGALRRQISALENDIGLWRNNLDFFASSKNADKLKKDFELKIEKANAQLQSLKEQLKIISNI